MSLSGIWKQPPQRPRIGLRGTENWAEKRQFFKKLSFEAVAAQFAFNFRSKLRFPLNATTRRDTISYTLRFVWNGPASKLRKPSSVSRLRNPKKWLLYTTTAEWRTIIGDATHEEN